MSKPVAQSYFPSYSLATEKFTAVYPADTEISVGDLLVFTMSSPEENKTMDIAYFDAPDDPDVTLAGELTGINGDQVVGVFWKIADADDADGTQTEIQVGPIGTKRKSCCCVRFDAGDFDAANPVPSVYGKSSLWAGDNRDPNLVLGCYTKLNNCFIGAVTGSENQVYSSVNAGWTMEAQLYAPSQSWGRIFELTAGLPVAGIAPTLEIDNTANSKYIGMMFAVAPATEVSGTREILTLDGSTKYATFPERQVGSTNSGACRFTFRLTAKNKEQVIIGGAATDGSHIRVSATNQLILRTSGSDVATSAADVVTTDVWHDVEIRAQKEGTDRIIFKVDGVEIVNTVSSSGIGWWACVGRRSLSDDQYLDGSIKNIQFEYDAGNPNTWAIDSGLTTPEDSVEGGLDLTFVNVVAGDWAEEGVSSDIVAPTLTLEGTTNATATTIDGIFTSDDGDAANTVYGVFTESDTQPSIAQLVAGQDDSSVAAAFATNQAGTGVGVQTVSASLTLVPGTTYTFHAFERDAAANDSNIVSSDPFTLEALPVSETYLDGTITSQSVLHYLNATAASGSATTAVVTGAGWTTNEWAGLTLVKDSDSSEGVVVSNTADTITYTGAADMTGGGLFDIVATLETNDVMWAESPVTVTSESVDIDYYVQDVSTTPDEWGAVTTQTINGLTGTPDGSYDVSLDAVGVITLTPVSAAFGIIQDLTRDLTQDLTRDIAG